MIRVTSTARNVGFRALRSIRSVIEQTYDDWKLDFHDAGSTDNTIDHMLDACRRHETTDWRVRLHYEGTPTGPLDKLIPLWRSFDDDDIIVWLDGDDELANSRVLETVAMYHDAGARLTYGQYMFQDGEIGWAGQVGPDPRNEPWRASHLKTFRAGLFKQIQDVDLRDADGSYFMTAIDRCVMLPMLEMEPARSVFIPKILYLYNYDISYEMTGTPEQQAAAQASCKLIHSRPKYAKLLLLDRETS